MFKVIRGRVKRTAFAHSLRLDRKLSGRHVVTKRGRLRRVAERPTLTRAMALALWTANRQATAACLRADRLSGVRPVRKAKAA